jgi:heme exporter protein C
MKMLIQLAGLAIGLYLGFTPALDKPRPTWWRWTLVLVVTLTVVLALAPRTAGTFADAVLMGRVSMNSDNTGSAGSANNSANTNPYTSTTTIVPVKVRVLHPTARFNAEAGESSVEMQDFTERGAVTALVRFRGALPAELTSAAVAIVNVSRGASDTEFIARSVVSTDPWLTLPFLPQLEERARNLYFHVPMSWVGILAYLMAMIYGYRYLKTNDPAYDVKSSASAALGTMFTVLATLTGMVWAQFNWGVAWNWDPRQTSIFILLMMYCAYFALRQAIESEERRARLSAVYVIFAFFPAVFLVFIMPRIMEGLHPGSGDSGSAGPLLSSQPDALNIVKQVIFSLSFGAFTMLYFWMLSLHIRIKTLSAHASAHAAARAAQH